MASKLSCTFLLASKLLKSQKALSYSFKPNICENLFKGHNINFNVGVQTRQFSKSAQSIDGNLESSREQKNLKRVYYGQLSPHMRAVKLFSLSSSIVGITMQPFLYKEIVSTGNVPIILAAYSFIGFFTVVTPFLLHFISKKYVLELHYNEDKDTFIAKTLNLFCVIKETEFKVEDVDVPDVPGMFSTFNVKGKPLFVDPRSFDYPEYYAKLMGYDKPMDFKLSSTEDRGSDK
ncbi:transmembrane protein 70 homolog, mitochondrial [Anthonomus grandis grandis]|uniref:transmembrane protein 70 homolog, mitochondrial n=1 Tax=Anthonomus grandis grandis TaxID=2921223 RepID=UPI0021662377|nr:transmembrane protein 70 homolog, mitochondrial [Anthonomus grandis grandis]